MANYLLAANNAISTLAGAITNTATTANLASGTGALFPNPSGSQYFVATLIDDATGLLREIVWVTARSTDTVTIERAQEGTTALNWNAGDLFQNLWTAGSMATLQQAGQYSVPDTGVANSIVVTLAPAPASWSALVGIPIFVTIGSGNTNTSGTIVIDPNGLGNKSVVLPDYLLPTIGSIVAGAQLALMYDGTKVQILGGLSPTSGKQTYTTHVGSPFTFTIPASTIGVEVWGAGGGGAGSNGTFGSGGGAGAYASIVLTGLTVGNTLTVTTGAGGAAGSSTGNGGNGGNSSVASDTQTISTITADGGSGGAVGSALAAGGSPVGSYDLGITGGWSATYPVTIPGTSTTQGSFGGDAPRGGGGGPSSLNGGNAGLSPGGGGGGGSSGTGVTSEVGGAGADGAVIITW